ncbi:MAG: hypothetical protein ACRCVG_00685 [Methanobacteriaceae archaeon]
MSEGRRVFVDKDDLRIYKNLRLTSGDLEGRSLTEIFSIAMILGKKQGFQSTLGETIDLIRSNTIDATNLRYLMMALAVEETGDLEILSKEKDYFEICEGYAKTGIIFLDKESQKSDFLDNLEFEMIESYVEQNIGEE